MSRSGGARGVSSVVPKGPAHAGVFAESAERFAAYVAVERRKMHAGTWPTAKLAAIARDRLVLHLGLDRALNFPARARALGSASPRELRREGRLLLKRDRAGPLYLGVDRHPGKLGFRARVMSGGRQVSLGPFSTQGSPQRCATASSSTCTGAIRRDVRSCSTSLARRFLRCRLRPRERLPSGSARRNARAASMACAVTIAPSWLARGA